MVTALFVYGSFRFGHDDFEVFDLSVEKTSGGILTGATMYVDPERNAPVIAMDNNPDGITGDIYYIDDNSWDPLIAEAESRMNQSLSFREVNLTDFETGEIVQASTWVLPTHQVGFFEAEAQIVPTGIGMCTTRTSSMNWSQRKRNTNSLTMNLLCSICMIPATIGMMTGRLLVHPSTPVDSLPLPTRVQVVGR